MPARQIDQWPGHGDCTGLLRQSVKARENNDRATLGMVRAHQDIACRKCRDTGYLDEPGDGGPHSPFGPLAWKLAGWPVDKIHWCDCQAGRDWRAWYARGLSDVTEARIERAFENAGIPPRFDGLGFHTIPLAHLEGKELALAAGRMFADRGWVRPSDVGHYDPGLEHRDSRRKPGVCFIGKPGVGKTGILSVAFRERLKRGTAGLWIELYEFFQAIQSQYGRDDGDADARIRAAQQADLLFLDDCGDPDRVTRNSYGKITGVAAETDNKRQLLWEVLDYRHAKETPTLITSNLARSEFETQWGTRLAARVWEMCWVVAVGGDDLRET